MRFTVPVTIGGAVLASTASSFAQAIGPGAITVTVHDAAGRPVAGVTVVLHGPSDRSATTTATGIVTLLALPAGTYDLHLARPGYATSEDAVTLGVRTPVRILAVRLAAVPLATTAAPLGLVRDVDLVTPGFGTAAALAAVPFLDVTPAGTTATIRAAGATVRETRLALDGIPLPDLTRGAAVFTGGGPAVTSVRVGAAGEGTGLTLDLRTPPLLGPSGVSVGSGVRVGNGLATLAAARQAGPLAAAFTSADETGGARTSSLQARLALSNVTSVAAETTRFQTGLRGSGADGAGLVALPVAAVSLETQAGDGRVALREYAASATYGGRAPASDARHGISADYDGRLGGARIGATYVRDVDTVIAGGTATQALHALTLRTAFALAPSVNLEGSQTRSAGTLLAPRTDSRVALTFAAAPGTTARVAAGSRYSSAPLDLAAGPPLPGADRPETATTIDASVERGGAATGRLSVDAFAIRRRDRFAATSDALSRGLSAGYERSPPQGALVVASATVASTVAFGAATPARDAGTTAFARSLGLTSGDADTPRFKVSLGGGYRSVRGFEGLVRATLSDSHGLAVPVPAVLGDVSLRVPVGTFALRAAAYASLSRASAPLVDVPGARLELTLERRLTP